MSELSPEELEDRRLFRTTMMQFHTTGESLRETTGRFEKLYNFIDILCTQIQNLTTHPPGWLQNLFTTMFATKTGVESGLKEIIEPQPSQTQKTLIEEKARLEELERVLKYPQRSSRYRELKKKYEEALLKAEEEKTYQMEQMESIRSTALSGTIAGSGMGDPSTMIFLTIAGIILKTMKEIFGPGIEMVQLLRSSGLPNVVKSFNIAAEPLIELIDTVNEMLLPVFLPIITGVTKEIKEQLPKIRETVDKFVSSGRLQQIGEDFARFAPLIPTYIDTMLRFALTVMEIAPKLLPVLEKILEVLNKQSLVSGYIKHADLFAIRFLQDVFKWFPGFGNLQMPLPRFFGQQI